jgi:hypothetical protein
MKNWTSSLEPKTLSAFTYFVNWQDFDLDYEDLQDEALEFGLEWEDCQEILDWWISNSSAEAIHLVTNSIDIYLIEKIESEDLSDEQAEKLQSFTDFFDELDYSMKKSFFTAIVGSISEDSSRDFEFFAFKIEGECGFEGEDSYQSIGKAVLKEWFEESELPMLLDEIYEIAKDEIMRIDSKIKN